MTSAEATKLHTQLAVAWLWNCRGCRLVADEVGVYPSGRLTEPANALWRADVVGIMWDHQKGPRIDVVEVKGHRADWRREKPLSPRSKWQQSQPSHSCLWLLVSATVDDNALESLPPWWGILRADPAAETVTVVRKAPQAGYDPEPSRSGHSVFVAGARSVTRSLPTMRHARDARGMLLQNSTAASLLSLRKSEWEPAEDVESLQPHATEAAP
jgi:hypothetical protein